MPNNISGSSKSSPEWFDAWRGVLFAHGRVIREIEKYLQAKHQLLLSWFDVLGRLASAPNARLRMSELQRPHCSPAAALPASLIASERPGW